MGETDLEEDEIGMVIKEGELLSFVFLSFNIE